MLLSKTTTSPFVCTRNENCILKENKITKPNRLIDIIKTQKWLVTVSVKKFRAKNLAKKIVRNYSISLENTLPQIIPTILIILCSSNVM